jgi:hypothetical protein
MILEDNQLDSYILYIQKMIENENQHQLEKWGVQRKHVFEWLAWTFEEFGEFIKEINELNYQRSFDYGKVITEGIQTITLLSKIVSSLIYISEMEAED